jgi:adenosine deaminase/adenosine deaminase CECR1
MQKPYSLLICLGFLFSSGLATVKVVAQNTLDNDEVTQVLRQQPPQTQNEAQTADWFETIRDRPTQLRAFMQRMPKGGDIHSHLSGAVYAESYLEWAAETGYCINKATLVIVIPADCSSESGYLPASSLLENTEVYNALIDDWSTRNLPFDDQSGHDQFFEAFGKFGSISDNVALKDDMVAEVANRAASQHITYLELMLTFQGGAVRRLGQEIGLSKGFAETRRLLLGDARFQKLLQKGLQELESLDTQRSQTLECETAKAQPGCGVTVRYLQQTIRTKQSAEVFAQFVYGFELAKADPRLVGINLVAPEDDPIALRDYTQQMEMLGFLHTQDSNVNVALHAGELTLGLVPPEDLRFHIRQAVEIAHARRIGHGVDIFYEDNPWQMLKTMSDKGILVEICLTSNDVILNVRGEEHPFPDYWNAGVPVTLASDDEGVSRIDLSHEYWRAALTYKLSYLDLKRLARNSLEYSFLSGESLWQSPDFTLVVQVCADDTPNSSYVSKECLDFLNTHDLAREQWKLEAEFEQFEQLSWSQ